MKIVNFIGVISLVSVLILSTYYMYDEIRSEQARIELKAIKNNPDSIIFIDYYNMGFNITPIATGMVTKYDTTNIFLYDTFDGFVESAEDAKIYLIFINENEMFLLKNHIYYQFKLKGTSIQQQEQMRKIKLLHTKHLNKFKNKQ